jgi:hypothetical protein
VDTRSKSRIGWSGLIRKLAIPLDLPLERIPISSQLAIVRSLSRKCYFQMIDTFLWMGNLDFSYSVRRDSGEDRLALRLGQVKRVGQVGLNWWRTESQSIKIFPDSPLQQIFRYLVQKFQWFSGQLRSRTTKIRWTYLDVLAVREQVSKTAKENVNLPPTPVARPSRF